MPRGPQTAPRTGNINTDVICCIRLVASRVECTAGRNDAIRMATRAMITNSSLFNIVTMIVRHANILSTQNLGRQSVAVKTVNQPRRFYVRFLDLPV